MKHTTPCPVLSAMRRSAMRKNPDVEIVESLAFGPLHPPGRAVGFRELAFLVDRHPREAVVGRVPQDHQYRGVLLHAVGPVTFLLEFPGRGAAWSCAAPIRSARW